MVFLLPRRLTQSAIYGSQIFDSHKWLLRLFRFSDTVFSTMTVFLEENNSQKKSGSEKIALLGSEDT